jgi:hypothetical protein
MQKWTQSIQNLADLILNKLTKHKKTMEFNNAQFQNAWVESLGGLLHSHCNVVDLVSSCWKKGNTPYVQLNDTETLATTLVHWNCNLPTLNLFSSKLATIKLTKTTTKTKLATLKPTNFKLSPSKLSSPNLQLSSLQLATISHKFLLWVILNFQTQKGNQTAPMSDSSIWFYDFKVTREIRVTPKPPSNKQALQAYKTSKSSNYQLVSVTLGRRTHKSGEYY